MLLFYWVRTHIYYLLQSKPKASPISFLNRLLLNVYGDLQQAFSLHLKTIPTALEWLLLRTSSDYVMVSLLKYLHLWSPTQQSSTYSWQPSSTNSLLKNNPPREYKGSLQFNATGKHLFRYAAHASQSCSILLVCHSNWGCCWLGVSLRKDGGAFHPSHESLLSASSYSVIGQWLFQE